MSRDFYPLAVLDTKEEIGGMARTVIFDVPGDLAEKFAWRAGQHLSFRFRLNEEEVRRSYSISSSSVSGNPLRITVKRVKDGLVSNHINDNVARGDVIDVMPPFGGFCLDTARNLRRTHYFFGAGSGITPLFSMLHSVMCNEPHSVACLAFGNTNADSILFRNSLSKISNEYGRRVSVKHVLSAPSKWSGFEYWRRGILDQDAIKALIDEHPPYAQDAQYYICGPGGMNNAVKGALMSLDVPLDRIHMENYGGAAEIDDTVKGVTATAEITLNGEQKNVSIEAGQTLLQAVRQAGLNPPFSCQSGVCGACRAKLTVGTVHMRARMALEESDIEKGHVLTCQSVPTSEALAITYEG